RSTALGLRAETCASPCMLKRNGKVATKDDQLNLFDFAGTRERENLSDAIRTNGRRPLAGIPAEDGSRDGGDRHVNGSAVRSAGENNRRNGSAHPTARNGTEADAAAGTRPGLGDDSGEIHSSPTGREPELNARNYRIRAEDRLGDGSLKQKFRDNIATIELVRRLDAESRGASEDEKRVLVKYVGWGGTPQVFASPLPAEWRSEGEELKALLTPEEYGAARASTLNAHYTAATVVSAIYHAVQHMGFTAGRILEPAAGIGHFFGLMPEKMSARSTLTGIEVDPLTAAIARQLYPDADIRAQGFEAASLPDDSFDLAISNVPFGDYKLHDPQFNDRNFLVHDYFFAKAVQHVRPGGLIAFITSRGTLDKVNSGLRDYLTAKVDLLGAIRLPNTAFKKNANTEVTTDIVFLRKLRDGEQPTGPAWQNLAEHVNQGGEVFQINEYFAAHPHMMLGQMANAGTMYRSNEPALVPDGRDLASALAEAVAALPRGIYLAAEQEISQLQSPPILKAPDNVKENAFTIVDGTIAIRTGGTLTPVANLPDETARRIRGMIKVREAVREVLRTQLDDREEDEVRDTRRQLNVLYDHFVSRFGPINESANRRTFRGDPDCPLLCSLEEYDEDTKRATKAAIFRERTIQQPQPARAAESPRDALVLSLNETGRVDLARMEALLGRSPEQFLPEIKGLVFLNPETREW